MVWMNQRDREKERVCVCVCVYVCVCNGMDRDGGTGTLTGRNHGGQAEDIRGGTPHIGNSSSSSRKEQ